MENEADADQVVSLFKGALSGDAATAAATIANSHIDESYWNTGADLEGDAVFGVDAKVSIASTVGYSRTKTGDIITTSVLSGKLDISATAAKYRKDAGELALGFGGDIEQELLYTMDDKETPQRLEVATTAGVKLTAEGSTSWTNDKVVNAIKKAESSGGAAAGGVVEVRAELGLTNEGDRAAAFMSALTNPSDDLGLVTAVASLYADTADIKVRAYAQADLTTGLRAKLAKGIVFDFDFGTTQTWKNLLFAFRGGADNLIVDKLCSTSAGTAKG